MPLHPTQRSERPRGPPTSDITAYAYPMNRPDSPYPLGDEFETGFAPVRDPPSPDVEIEVLRDGEAVIKDAWFVKYRVTFEGSPRRVIEPRLERFIRETLAHLLGPR